MGKTVKARSIGRPKGQKPKIHLRVEQELFDQAEKASKQSGHSISEEITVEPGEELELRITP